jgi:hypothetical protein
MAKQRYYGEKFQPTKGAFGNRSNYQKRLEQQADLRKQIAEYETKQNQQADEVVETKHTKEVIVDKTKEAQTQKDVSTTTE